MILPIALLALSLVRQSASVSFTCRAEPLSHLVVDLSKATGLNLTVSKECANDVLLISVQGVTVSTLLAEIAKVDAGQWQTDGAGQRFSANTAARHAEARAEMVRQAKVVKAVIQKEEANVLKRESQGSPGEDGSTAQNLQGLSQQDVNRVNAVLNGVSAEEAVLTILENVDPEILVLQREQRVVLSTHPTGMQLQLEAGADSAIAGFVEKRNAVGKILESMMAGKPKKSTTGDPDGPPNTPRIKQTEGYSKADLAVMDGGSPGEFEVQLTLYTAEGGVALRTRVFEIRREQSEDPGPAASTKIEVSDAAKAFRTMYVSQMVGNSAIVAVPPTIAPYFMDVEHNDPLALSPSDEILAVARSQRKPLVAVLPDRAFIDTMPVGSSLTLETFTQSLASGETMTMANSGDWIEIKPANPATARQYRCDRAALGVFLRSCMKESIPTIDEFAEFTTKGDLANNDVVGAYLSTAVSGYGNGGLGTEANWDLYRIFSEFSPDQRANLLGGAKLPLTVLTSSQQANFSQLGYGTLQRLKYGTGPAPLSGNFPSARKIGSDPSQTIQRAGLPPVQGYENEPTELLPNGVQSSGYIELKVVEEPFVSPYGPTTTPLVVHRVMGVAQVAQRQVQSAQPDFAQNGAIKFDRFKPGIRKLHVLTIHGSDRAFVSGRLYDFHLYQDSPDFAMGELSSDWQSELTRRVTVLKQEQAQEGGRKVVPPPSPR